MQVTDELIRGVVQEVLKHMRNGKPSRDGSATGGAWGVFQDVNTAVEAATAAQAEFAKRGLDDRRKAVACVRKICVEQSEPLGREGFGETKIGRLGPKGEKR